MHHHMRWGRRRTARKPHGHMRSPLLLAEGLDGEVAARGGEADGAKDEHTSDAFVDSPDYPGNAELNLGSWLIVPIAIGSLFVQTDTVSGTSELVGIANSLSVMAGWLVLVPLSLGAALSLYPELTGRHLFSNNRARWGYLMMTGGAIFGLSLTMIADFMDMALVEMMVEDPSTLSEELRKLGSVMFYGVVIGAILHSLNMVTGIFRGEIISSDSVKSSSISIESYSLVSSTTVRKILASGANLDTEVIPIGEEDEKGSATKLYVTIFLEAQDLIF